MLCPVCHEDLELPEGCEGRKAQCTICGNKFIIPIRSKKAEEKESIGHFIVSAFASLVLSLVFYGVKDIIGGLPSKVLGQVFMLIAAASIAEMYHQKWGEKKKAKQQRQKAERGPMDHHEPGKKNNNMHFNYKDLIMSVKNKIQHVDMLKVYINLLVTIPMLWLIVTRTIKAYRTNKIEDGVFVYMKGEAYCNRCNGKHNISVKAEQKWDGGTSDQGWVAYVSLLPKGRCNPNLIREYSLILRNGLLVNMKFEEFIDPDYDPSDNINYDDLGQHPR